MKKYDIDDETYAVYRDRLYRKTGETTNPRVLHLADRVRGLDCHEAYENQLLSANADGDGTIFVSHHRAGTLNIYSPSEWTDMTYEMYEEVENE
jgi:hypothetical protein